MDAVLFELLKESLNTPKFMDDTTVAVLACMASIEK
jgi:hypothetical protein